MTQRGFVSSEGGTWRLNVALDHIDLEVPENLRGMIEAQIERLDPEQQRVLDVASVSGISFTANVNAVAGNLDEDRLEELCEELSAASRWCAGGGASVPGRDRFTTL